MLLRDSEVAKEVRTQLLNTEENTATSVFFFSDNLVNRVEVLDKVKDLLLLPELEMATTSQVADFYEVPMQAIKSLVTDKKMN